MNLPPFLDTPLASAASTESATDATDATSAPATKPGAHPEFFTRPPPEGRSRESTISLTGAGTFLHDGEPIEHPRLAQAMHTWIDRHPTDGRPILNNGYDWTYFTVVDVPYFVRSVIDDGEGFPVLVLSDGTTEPLGPHIRLGEHDTIYVEVKTDAANGPHEAKFLRHAQAELGPYLVECGEEGSHVAVRTRRGTIALPL